MQQQESKFLFAFAPSVFAPTRDAMRQAAARFWSGQEHVLDAIDDYTNTWLERRRSGVHEALVAAQQIADAATPAEALHEYQRWAIGAMERLVHDGLACQKHWLSVGALMAPPLSPFGEKADADERVAEEPKRRSPSRVAA
jgi:hypothetical protein